MYALYGEEVVNMYVCVCLCVYKYEMLRMGWAELADCLVSFLYGRQFTFYVA